MYIEHRNADVAQLTHKLAERDDKIKELLQEEQEAQYLEMKLIGDSGGDISPVKVQVLLYVRLWVVHGRFCVGVSGEFPWLCLSGALRISLEMQGASPSSHHAGVPQLLHEDEACFNSLMDDVGGEIEQCEGKATNIPMQPGPDQPGH